MALVRFYRPPSNGVDELNISRTLTIPKKVTSVAHWFKQARIAIDMIPTVSNTAAPSSDKIAGDLNMYVKGVFEQSSQWIVKEVTCTPTTIAFVLQCKKSSATCYVGIDRAKNAMTL